jgi:hypothetical protein
VIGVKQRTAELIVEAKRRLVEEVCEADSKADALGQMLRRLTGETNQQVGDLLREHAVREFSTGIPTVSGLVSSKRLWAKRLREIELQFDVEAMGGGASDEG